MYIKNVVVPTPHTHPDPNLISICLSAVCSCSEILQSPSIAAFSVRHKTLGGGARAMLHYGI